MKVFLSVLALALLPIVLTQADSLSDTLSEEEFKAAGLHKLTDQELAKLNSLWNRETLPPASIETPSPPSSNAQREDLVGKEQIEPNVSKAPKEIESRLKGTFNGWYGSTVFHLENGQVWQQRIKEVQKYSPTENPTVTVKRALGGYRLQIEGYRQTCPVKRIK